MYLDVEIKNRRGYWEVFMADFITWSAAQDVLAQVREMGYTARLVAHS